MLVVILVLYLNDTYKPWLRLGSILFCTFMALNVCQADSKVQHQNQKNHISIAVGKSSTTETPDRAYANLGRPF